MQQQTTTSKAHCSADYNFSHGKLVNSILVNISTANIALDYNIYEQASGYMKKALGYLAELMMPDEVVITGGQVSYSSSSRETYGWLLISSGGYVDPIVNEFFKKSEAARINLLRAEITDANTYIHPEMIKRSLEKSLNALNEKSYEISSKSLEEVQQAVFVEGKDEDLPMEKLRDKLILARDFVIFENTKIAQSALSQAKIYFDLNKKLLSSNPKNSDSLQVISEKFEEVSRHLSKTDLDNFQDSSIKLNHLIEEMDNLQ